MKAARDRASAGIGRVISMGCDLMSPERQAHLQSTILSRICETLPQLHFGVQKCYALVLTATELVSYQSNLASYTVIIIVEFFSLPSFSW